MAVSAPPAALAVAVPMAVARVIALSAVTTRKLRGCKTLPYPLSLPGPCRIRLTGLAEIPRRSRRSLVRMGHRNSSWSRKLIMPGASLRVPDVVLTGSAHSEGHRGHRPPEPDPRHACPLHRTHNGMKPQKATSELQRWARHKKGLPYMQESAVLPLGPQAGSGGYPGSAIRP